MNNSRRSWLVSDIEATCAKSAPTMVDGSSLMSLNDIFRDESVREKVILENIRHRKGWQDIAGGEFWCRFFKNYWDFSHRWLRRQNCSTQTPSSPSICTNTLLGVSTTIQFTKTQLIWKKISTSQIIFKLKAPSLRSLLLCWCGYWAEVNSMMRLYLTIGNYQKTFLVMTIS